jgi:hypothetical protein
LLQFVARISSVRRETKNEGRNYKNNGFVVADKSKRVGNGIEREEE